MAENSVGGINNVNFNIGNGKMANTVKPVLTSARQIQGLNKKNSLSAMTKDLIMQYPCFLDNAIDTETQMIVVKADEKNYAALHMALWSADTAFGVDPTSTGGVRDFVRKYHSNSDTPDMISYAGNLTRNISSFRGEYSATESTFEPGTEIELLTMKPINCPLSKEDIASMWDTIEDRITMECVNNAYLPNKPVIDKINRVAAAIESSNAAKEKFTEKYNRVQSSGFKANVDYGRTEDEQKGYRNTKDYHLSQIRSGTSNAVLVRNDKLTMMEPTLLEVEFFVRNPGGGGQVQKAIIGVKCMPRVVSTPAMCSNIISALQGNSASFQFVKWTRGEVKIVRDLIFNVSQIKQDAITKDKFDRYFGAMRKRKNNFKTFKFGDATVNPFTTIVVSSDTVETIKSTSGYDLNDPMIAKRLIDALFLLGFQIVDSNTGTVATMLDDWTSFSNVTINSLKGGINKETDMTQIKETLRLMGRSVY